MVFLVVVVLSLLALIGITNWLRSGGGYDKKTGPVIGPEPPDWKPHEEEPWEADPKLFGPKQPRDR